MKRTFYLRIDQDVLMKKLWFLIALLTLGGFLQRTYGEEPSGHDSRPNFIVIYTDDHGHADLSCQDVLNDIRTPNIDALARSGARMLHGYSTAPQCVPSRAGLLIGKFQSRFGLESNASDLAGFNKELTIAERLTKVGYVTAQFGKWHLGPTQQITDHGFQHVFSQNAGRPFSANIDLVGNDRPMSLLKPSEYHVDGCSKAVAAMLRRHHERPFFFYLAYRAPHVPLDATPKYLARFPGKMPERRRQALAMLSAVDDGVGLICETLDELGLRENTVIFFIGDNGAPLKIHKADLPGGGPGWDGSLNDPLNGEKGMLSEGGMHVPFVVSWPNGISAGQNYQHPVSALDVAATTAHLAGVPVQKGDLDGVNLIPFLSGEIETPPHDELMWRWIAQSAIREGDWKLLRGGTREYLYNLRSDLEEKNDLSEMYPEIVDRLRKKLEDWASKLDPPGLAEKPMSSTWESYFDFYLDGKPAPPLREKFRADVGSGGAIRGWIARGGKLSTDDGKLTLRSPNGADAKPAFFVRNGISIMGRAVATISVRSEKPGKVTIAWRTKSQKTFEPECRVSFPVTASKEISPVKVELPVEGELVHLRVIVPPGKSQLADFTLQGTSGNPERLW